VRSRSKSRGAERNRSRSRVLTILDILTRSGDTCIRDQSLKLHKIDVLAPNLFWWEPPNFGTCIIKRTYFPIILQNVTAIGRVSSGISWRREWRTSRVEKTRNEKLEGECVPCGVCREWKGQEKPFVLLWFGPNSTIICLQVIDVPYF